MLIVLIGLALTLKKQHLYFVFVFALPIVWVLWWWGLFSSASVVVEERGNYTYAYMDAEDVYSKLDKKRNEVRFYLNKQHAEIGAQITLILTDPRTTPHEKLRAKTGYLVNANFVAQEPLKLGHIAKRKVVVASIKAHPLFAYGKAYQALIEFTKTSNSEMQMPTVEIVNASVLSVEMPTQKESQQ